MAAEIRYLDARRPRGPVDPQTAMIAARYVGLAEEALALLPQAPDPEGRSAICWISEAWLSLAEAQLKGASPSRRD
jgi:hypothetical protein